MIGEFLHRKHRKRLVLHFAGMLSPDDEARIYPVCARCRQKASLFGTRDLAQVPPAYIF